MAIEGDFGILDESEITVIGDTYRVTIDPSDLTQYKLCQVIKYLEKKVQLAENKNGPVK